METGRQRMLRRAPAGTGCTCNRRVKTQPKHGMGHGSRATGQRVTDVHTFQLREDTGATRIKVRTPRATRIKVQASAAMKLVARGH